jgi:phosphoserine phosphatase
MTTTATWWYGLVAGSAMALLGTPAVSQTGDPLPSWHDGAVKRSIVAFVDDVAREGGARYVPPPERIAVFDNDGTLWSEQPVYFQLLFVLDRVKALAPAHPEWKNDPLFQAALGRDLKAVFSGGEAGLVKLLTTTHAGMTEAEWEGIVRDWIGQAKHPRFDRRYTECVFQPMLELLAWLRANGFKTFIVSGGGVDFMRPWAERVYGVPPEQVVGSTLKVEFEMRDGKPELRRLPEIDFINDKEGKVIAIHRQIGRRPILAFGNSDGDLSMLQWTHAGTGPNLCLLVHHTDADREWAYDRKSPVGRLDKALDAAQSCGWSVVDMKRDWKRVFAFEK